MTTAERLRAEGWEKGRDEGRAEGHAIALTDLLSARFGSLPREVGEKITTADAARLRAWFRRALTATTIDEVFDQA